MSHCPASIRPQPYIHAAHVASLQACPVNHRNENTDCLVSIQPEEINVINSLNNNLLIRWSGLLQPHLVCLTQKNLQRRIN